MSNFFGNSPWIGGGGSPGAPINVIDNFDSNSGTDALSAGKGRELKLYVDELKKRLTAKTYLRKYEFQLIPTESGQTTFEIPYDRYNPEDFEELIFLNTTKVSDNYYTISQSNTSSRYNITFNSGLSTTAVINIVLLTEEDEEGNISLGLEKREYILTLSEEDQVNIEIPLEDYSPEKYVEMLFFNTTKMLPSNYSITKIDDSDPESKYQIVLSESPLEYESATFNLVLLTNGNERTGFDGSFGLRNTALFNISGVVREGRVVEAFFPVPYDCKIINAIATVVNTSSENIELNVEKTVDFTNFETILPTNLIIDSNSNSKKLDVGYDLIVNKGDNLFVNILESFQDARNMVVTLTIEKI